LRLLDDAGGVVHDQTVEEGAAVGRNSEAEPFGAKQPDERLCHETALQSQAEIVARGLLVHGVKEIAGSAFGHGLGGPERRVELGRKRIGGIGGRAQPQQRKVLQRRRGRADPASTVVD